MNQGIWLWKFKKYSKKENKKLKLARELLSCSGNPESHEWQRINSSLQHQHSIQINYGMRMKKISMKGWLVDSVPKSTN